MTASLGNLALELNSFFRSPFKYFAFSIIETEPGPGIS